MSTIELDQKYSTENGITNSKNFKKFQKKFKKFEEKNSFSYTQKFSGKTSVLDDLDR